MATTDIASSISAKNIASATESLLNIQNTLAKIETHIQELLQSSSTFDNSDWIAFASAITAIVSLLIGVYQAYLMRRHNRLSVKPHLDLFMDCTESEFRLSVRNDGLGPALIISAKIKLNDARYDLFKSDEVNRLVEELAIFNNLNINEINKTTFRGKTSLRSGAELDFIKFSYNANDSEPKFASHIEYESMYGERFVCNSDKVAP